MLKVVLYSHHIRAVSGIHTWEKAFIQKLSKDFDLELVYRTASHLKLKEFQDIVKCTEYNGQEIECDVCIYTSTIRKSPKIKAKKYIQVVHADLKRYDPIYTPEGIDQHIAVSKFIQEEIKRDFNIDSIVISNILPEPEVEKFVRFITCTRIAEGKGIERIVQMAKIMKVLGFRFTWEIYGGGAGQDREYLKNIQAQLVDVPEVNFLGLRDKIASYISKADYLVQLSDSEGFCYSVYEALQLGTPVIVTNWEGVDQVVIDGKNGYILDMNLSNLDLQKIFNHIPSGYIPNQTQPEKQWIELLKSYERE